MERWGTRCLSCASQLYKSSSSLPYIASTTTRTSSIRFNTRLQRHRIPLVSSRSFVTTPGLYHKYKSHLRSHVVNGVQTIPMTTHLEIAATPTVDTPGTTIYVHNDKHTYVFGRIAEGTQRAFNNRHIGMSGTEHVFLSGSVNWEQLGGLFGYLLTVGGAVESSKEQLAASNAERAIKGQKQIKWTQNDKIGVHGGDNLCHVLATGRPIILRQPVSVTTFEQRSDPRRETLENIEPDWEDDAIRVWKIPVKRARSSSPQKRRLATPDNLEKDGQIPAEEVFKENSISNPDVAKVVVEKLMFNGHLKGHGFLIPRKLGRVKPTDTAMTKEGNDLRIYNGPVGADAPNPEVTVWVVPTKSDNLPASNTIQMAHRPLPPTTYSQTSMSYLVKCTTRRGKFDPKAATQLGVKPFNFKYLTQGMTVKNEKGEDVTPDQVLGAPQPGRGFIVADIATYDFLDDFMQRPGWSNAELMADVVAVYWIVGPGMANDLKVQKFMKDHPDMKHIFCASDTCPNMIALNGPAELQTRLRRIDPDRFSLLQFENSVKVSPPQGNAELGRVGQKVMLMPRLVHNPDCVAPFPDLLSAAQSVSEEHMSLARKAKADTTDPDFLKHIEEEQKDIPSLDAEVIPLGTGSSIPGKYRNVSATLIRVPGLGSYIMDCGEGTLGQLSRLFGPEETMNIIRDLRCIVISHLHADHQLGTPTLIKAWYEATLHDHNAKLAISCIARYRDLLQEVSQVEDIGYHRLCFVSCSNAKDINHTTPGHLRNHGVDDNFGLAAIKRVPVPHCWRAYATEIELTSGLRIAYSGDCRPSDDFARVCQGAHLLIHECTFDDDMASHALAKNHCTMKEALQVASKMRARRVLLTHFSQRYVKSESLRRAERETAVKEDQAVLMAFDQMRVKLGDWRVAAAYQPVIQSMLEKGAD